MKQLLYIIILVITFSPLNAQNVTHIDLTKAKFGEIDAEKIFEDIEIVPLETHRNGLLRINSTSYYLTENYIIAAGYLRGAYLFDRKTGAFIREAGSRGLGPNEYSGWIYHTYGFDQENNILFASDGAYIGKGWKCINLETNKVESTLKIPLPENRNEYFPVTSPWRIKDNLYVSFCSNTTGTDKTRLIISDKDGNLLKEYPHYLEYDMNGKRSFSSASGIFYYYNGRTCFKEWNYNDTVFCVDEKKMSPHIIFELGNKHASYYHQNDAEYNKGKYLINFVYESDLFVLFNFFTYQEMFEFAGSSYSGSGSTHTGYYDKKSKQAYISSTPDYKKSGYAINDFPLSFYPLAVNKNNEIIAQINPEDLINYEDKIGSKYKHLFQDIQIDDNPIVIIAKLKE